MPDGLCCDRIYTDILHQTVKNVEKNMYTCVFGSSFTSASNDHPTSKSLVNMFHFSIVLANVHLYLLFSQKC